VIAARAAGVAATVVELWVAALRVFAGDVAGAAGPADGAVWSSKGSAAGAAVDAASAWTVALDAAAFGSDAVGAGEVEDAAAPAAVVEPLAVARKGASRGSMDLSDAVAEASAPLAVAAGAAGRAGPLGDPADAEADTISASNPAVGLSAAAALTLLDATPFGPPFDEGAGVPGWLDAAAPVGDAAADVNPLAVLRISRTAASRASGCADAWRAAACAGSAGSESEGAVEPSAAANG
jgi:hypothetical protein